jgi:hypothetical protein
LAYAPQTLDKNGQWQSAMGNLFADVVMAKGNPVFRNVKTKQWISSCSTTVASGRLSQKER